MALAANTIPREFRTQESYHAEKVTRAMIASFLRERGFREVDDQRKKYGQNQAQTIRAIDDAGQQVVMGVRLCWRPRGKEPEENFAAAQLLAGIDGTDWIGSLTQKMAREKREGKRTCSSSSERATPSSTLLFYRLTRWFPSGLPRETRASG